MRASRGQKPAANGPPQQHRPHSVAPPPRPPAPVAVAVAVPAGAPAALAVAVPAGAPAAVAVAVPAGAPAALAVAAPLARSAARARRRAATARARSARARSAHAAIRALRLLGAFAAHAFLGLALGLLLALTAPLAVGMRPLVVLSGSMEPALHVGDVAVVQRIAPRDARVGDVVTFKAPDGGRITTHRVRAVREADGGRLAFTTKGDANNSLERWTLPADGELSRAVYGVPLVGRALLAIRTPLGWVLLVGLPLLALGAQEIRRIWRSPPAPAAEAADAPLVA